MKGDVLRGHLDLLVLQVLADNPLHGYAVIEELKRRSDDALEVPEGTLYPVLHRLEHDGLLSASWAEVNGRRRKSYRLNQRGHAALAERRHGWAHFRAAMDAVLGGAAAQRLGSTPPVIGSRP